MAMVHANDILVESPDFKIAHKKHVGRWVAGLVVIVILGRLLFSIATNHRFGWPVIGEYLFSPLIVSGIWMTLFLTVVSMIIGLLLGLILATMRLSSNPVVNQTAHGYVVLFRGTPILVQLLFWFNLAALYPVISFGIPGVEISANRVITPILAAILGFCLNEAAYMSEIVRAGIISVSSGQSEAAAALGLSKRQTFVKIILPQAMRVIIPPTGNQFVSMLKATSLVSVIAVSDLLYSAQTIYSQNLQVMPLLIVASLWYVVLTTIANFGQGYIERYYGRGSGAVRVTKKRKLRQKFIQRNAFNSTDVVKESAS